MPVLKREYQHVVRTMIKAKFGKLELQCYEACLLDTISAILASTSEKKEYQR